MGVFYHPFKEKGNQAKTFLLNDTDDTIALFGDENCDIYPMLDGIITNISENSISIETELSGYSKHTKEKVTIIYEHLTVEASLTISSNITKDTKVGVLSKSGDEQSPYLAISIRSNNKSISVDELYKQDKNFVPRYDELRKKGLTSFSTNTIHSAGSNYSKLIFVQEPRLTTVSYNMNYDLSGIVGIAAGELCDMIKDPYSYTGLSMDQLGATKPNKYQLYCGHHGTTMQWCAAFVSYCADKAGYVSNGLYPSPKGTSCGNIIDNFRSIGNQPKEPLNYTPVPGDLIFFNWADSREDGVDHIGIVYYVTSDSVFTIEGNTCKTPHKFIENINYLANVNPTDPIVVTVEEVCKKNFNNNVNEMGNIYDAYVRKNYSDAGATLYSEFNGVALNKYNRQYDSIELYIHME